MAEVIRYVDKQIWKNRLEPVESQVLRLLVGHYGKEELSNVLLHLGPIKTIKFFQLKLKLTWEVEDGVPTLWVRQ